MVLETADACLNLEEYAAYYFENQRERFAKSESLSLDQKSHVTKMVAEAGTFVAKTYPTQDSFEADKIRFEWLTQFEDLLAQMKVELIKRVYSDKDPLSVFMEYLNFPSVHNQLLDGVEGSIENRGMQNSFNGTMKKLSELICARHGCKANNFSSPTFYRSKTLDGTKVFRIRIPEAFPENSGVLSKVIYFKSDNIVWHPKKRRWILFDPF